MHFDFPLPFNSELKHLIPYRTNKKLVEHTKLVLSHPFNKYHKLCNSYLNKYPYTTEELASLAVGCLREFYLNPQHYGHSIDNIRMQILIKMFKKLVYKYKTTEELNKYLPLKLKLLTVTDTFFNTLQETCTKEDYYLTPDSMIKKRHKKGLRETCITREGSKHFEYLANLV